MPVVQTVTFQQALETVEALPQEQIEDLVDVVRRRLTEQKRDRLAGQIKQAREEYQRGETRRGTVDDLMKDMADENANLG